MKRRTFITTIMACGLAATPAAAAVYRGPFYRLRFRKALKRVIREKRAEARKKRKEGEITAAQYDTLVAGFDKKVAYNGRVATVADHVMDELDVELSWWESIYNWIIENWDEILAILLKLVPLLLLLL